MNVEILQDNLAKQLSIVQRFVPNKSSMPILSNIKIWTGAHELHFLASDMETVIETKIKAKIDEQGMIAVPAKLMQQYVKMLSKGSLSLTAENTSVSLQQGKNSKATINGVDPEEFPTFPELEYELSFEIETSFLEKVLTLVSFSASSDESRPTLASILFTKVEDGFHIVSTDGYRLSLLNLDSSLDIDSDNLLIPAKILSEVTKIAQDSSLESVIFKVNKEKKSIRFEIGEATIVARLIEGDYPPYAKILPESSQVTAAVDRISLIDAVKAAGLFSQHNAHLITFTLQPNKIVVAAQSNQFGKQATTLEARIEGLEEELLVAFNSRYVSDLLSHISHDEIQVKVNGALEPVTFSSSSEPEYVHVIMPVRTSG